jgi:hypothetical protein
MTNPSALARLLFDFLDYADENDVNVLASSLGEITANACPQGAAIKVAYLNELVAAIALGGEVAADRVIDEAADRRDAERNPVAERDEAADDVRVYRGLRRLLTANARRSCKASRDILDQVPN